MSLRHADLPDGPFSTKDAETLGITRRRLYVAVRHGVVRRVLREVYVAAALPDTPELRAAAASKVLPSRMVVCDRSAAWLHGIDAFDPAASEVPPDLDIATASGTRTRRSGLRGGRRDLSPDDVMVLHGVPVTTPLRTAADLACLRGRLAAMAVLDRFARHHDLTSADYTAMADRFAGRRGVTQLRELAPLADPRAESPPESWVRLTIHDHGLPIPTPQVWVLLPSGWARLDTGYASLKICVEYDGEEYHTSDEDREHDEARREALRLLGWKVIVVRKDGFAGATLDAWLDELRTALRDRAPTGRPVYARAPRERRNRRYRVAG